MKKYFIALLFLIPAICFSQTMDTRVTVSIQARDCEFIAGVVFDEPFEFDVIYYKIKTKFTVQNPPTGTTNVQIDTVTIRDWLSLAARLRRDPYAVGGGVVTRFETALRAAGNTFLNSELDEKAAADTNKFSETRDQGRIWLRRN